MSNQYIATRRQALKKWWHGTIAPVLAELLDLTFPDKPFSAEQVVDMTYSWDLSPLSDEQLDLLAEIWIIFHCIYGSCHNCGTGLTIPRNHWQVKCPNKECRILVTRSSVISGTKPEEAREAGKSFQQRRIEYGSGS